MDSIGYAIEWVFSFALFFNAALFAIQALKIYKEKSAQGISCVTFSGFLLIQLATIFHAVLKQDYLLAGGNLLSLLTCSAVILLALFYRKA
jgi:uncharacterized protein with PQ loop repeat